MAHSRGYVTSALNNILQCNPPSTHILNDTHPKFALFRLQKDFVFAETLEYYFQTFEELVIAFPVNNAVIDIHLAYIVYQAGQYD